MEQDVPSFDTVDDFLVWSERQQSGRYELEDGVVIVIQAQNVGHLRFKKGILAALRAAIAEAGVAYYGMPDGATVRIAKRKAYEPDALVAPLPMPPDTSLEISNPIIVVEVLSPSTVQRDLVIKAACYAQVPSIQHYLVVDREAGNVLHYRRVGGVLAPPEEPSTEVLELDPPGLRVDLKPVFAEPC